MAHAAELISKIESLLVEDYPPDTYSYQRERGLPENPRMRPDILILDQRDRCVCAVEVGYTRPEKLTAYRETYAIPDVRWYGKDGKLHTTFERPVVKAHLKLEPAREFRVYELLSQVSCDECYEERLADDEEEEAGSGEANSDAHHEASFDDVETAIVTDCVKAFFVCYCDRCGRAWLADKEDYGIVFLLEDLKNLTRDSCRTLGKIQHRGSWESVQRYFEILQNKSDYADGLWVNPDHKDEALKLQLVVGRSLEAATAS